MFLRLLGASMRRCATALALIAFIGGGTPPHVAALTTDPSTLILFQDTEPDDPVDFAFTTTFDTGAVLDDDADPTLSNTTLWTIVDPGEYQVTQQPVSGWRLDGISCVGDTAGVSVAGSSVVLSLTGGEIIQCAFHDSPNLGTVVIGLDTIPDDPMDIDFQGDLGTFALDDDPASTTPSTKIFTLVPEGTVSVNELTPNGWRSSITCFDPDGGTQAGSLAALIDVDAGETITCWFTTVQATPTCQGLDATIVTRTGGTVRGTNGRDVIVALGPKDANIDARAGDDVICASDGNDTITAGTGNDWIDAGQGGDYVDAGAGNDAVYARDGDNTVLGGRGDDWLIAGAGNDTIDGGRELDTCGSASGVDTIRNCEQAAS
jgi:Ca2+-binding RTX toxin-like protein